MIEIHTDGMGSILIADIIAIIKLKRTPVDTHITDTGAPRQVVRNSIEVAYMAVLSLVIQYAALYKMWK